MKKTKIVLLILFITAIFLMVLSACQKDGNNSDQDNPVKVTPQNGEVPPSDDPRAVVPIIDYDGKEFNFFVCDQAFIHRDIISEELTGDPLRDAMYNRFKTIEDKYNIQINFVCKGTAPETHQYLSRSIAADDATYDLTYVHLTSFGPVVSQGLVMDWNSLPYPDFNNLWWNKSFVDAMSVKNVLLFAPSYIEFPYSTAIAFNKQMVKDYNLESPYQLVRDGKWTMDKFFEIATNFSRDLNGDGIWTVDDQYGFTTNNNYVLRSYLYAGGYPILTKDENDIPQLNKDYPRLSMIVDKTMKLFTQSNVSYMYPDNVNGDFPITMSSGRIFAIGLHLAELSMLRGSEVDYGIVPLPKLNEAQENYTGIQWGGFFSVPINAPDPEMSSLIFEALTAESHYSALPVFMENQLSIKFARDEESIEMLEMIYSNILYDMGANYPTLGQYSDILRWLFESKTTNVMSHMEKYEQQLENALEEIIASYDAYLK